MEEIPHHLLYLWNLMKKCDIPHINWCKIPSINSSEELKGQH